jgi:predicted nucleic acid-binding protein
VSVFVDASAVYALLDAGDANHPAAVGAADRLLGEELVTHSYVVAELVSLVRRRLGHEAAARLIDDVLPALEIADVDAQLRARAMAAFRAAIGSDVSLVGRTSFEFMRENGIRRVWSTDSHFAAEGFELEA